MAAVYTTRLYDRLDRICYQYYGSDQPRHVEIVLEANPGLESYPILLPINIKITLPDAVTPVTVKKVNAIRLFQ